MFRYISSIMKRFLLLIANILLIVSCKTSDYEVTQIRGEQLSVSDSIEANDSITQFIRPYKENIDREMNSVLAYSVANLVKTDGELNTAIGNMMADAVLELANPVFHKRTGDSIDMVLLNHGGIRSSLNQGEITTRSAFQIMPFENEVVVAKMDGNAVRKLVRYLIDSGTAHPVSGLELILDNNNAIEKLLIGGRPLENDQVYFVATNDYLLQGGDNMVFFDLASEVTNLDYKIRNLLIDYFKKHDTIAPVKDGRFIKLK